MIHLDPARTAVVAVDMHRGHLDPAVASLPLAAERCGPVIQARGSALRRSERARRADRSRGDRVPRCCGDRRQPVLEGRARRSDEGAQRDPPAQPRGQPGDRDHPRAARRARRRRARQEALQRVRADRPRVRAAAPARRRHRDPGRDQHHDVRAVRRRGGHEPRLPRGGGDRRRRLHGRGRHAPLRAETDRGRPRVAAHPRRDPPGSRSRTLKEADMRRLLVILAVAVIVAGVAAGAPSWAQKGPIKVGMLVPQTGPLAANGKDMINGFELFFEEHKYRLAGREIKFIVEDDEGKPATGITKARGLVEGQGVHLLTGPLSAAVGYAVSPYIESKRIPAIYPIVSADDLTQRKRNPYLVRTGWTSSQPSHPFGKWVVDNLKYRKIAMIGYDFAFGWEVAAGFQRSFEE